MRTTAWSETNSTVGWERYSRRRTKPPGNYVLDGDIAFEYYRNATTIRQLDI